MREDMKKAVHQHVKVRRAAHGLGLFAAGPINKGEMIGEYWGEVITEAEANRRGGKYLFELENEMAIDGKTRRNIPRYINHSCNPNCEPQEDVAKRRVFIVARRNIAAGEELAYNYGKEYWLEHIKPHKCRCGCGGRGARRWR
jgi:SET domain-containing protein